MWDIGILNVQRDLYYCLIYKKVEKSIPTLLCNAFKKFPSSYLVSTNNKQDIFLNHGC